MTAKQSDQQEYEVLSRNIGISTWLLVLLSTAVVFSLLYAGHRIVTYRHQTELLADLQKRFDGSETLNSIVGDSRYFELVPANSPQRASIQNAVALGMLVREGRYESATRKLSVPPLIDFPGAREYLAAIKNITANDLEIDEISKQAADLARRSKAQVGFYSLLAQQLRTALGIPGGNDSTPAASGDAEEEEESAPVFSLYEAGVLANLPPIPALPDNIPDARALLPLLNALGSPIQYRPLVDAQAEQLAEIRKQIQQLLANNDQLAKDYSAYHQSIALAEQRQQDKKKSLGNAERAMFLALMTPNDYADSKQFYLRSLGLYKKLSSDYHRLAARISGAF